MDNSNPATSPSVLVVIIVAIVCIFYRNISRRQPFELATVERAVVAAVAAAAATCENSVSVLGQDTRCGYPG